MPKRILSYFTILAFMLCASEIRPTTYQHTKKDYAIAGLYALTGCAVHIANHKGSGALADLCCTSNGWTKTITRVGASILVGTIVHTISKKWLEYISPADKQHPDFTNLTNQAFAIGGFLPNLYYFSSWACSKISHSAFNVSTTPVPQYNSHSVTPSELLAFY